MKSNTGKNILVCGSMSHYKAMVYCSKRLTQYEIPTHVPENEQAIAELPKKLSLEEKNQLSRKWLKNITSSSTYGILVVNEAKGDVENYIGANTFAEIVIAFNASKRIFLLHNLYPPFADELLAWNALPLFGNLENLASTYWEAFRSQSISETETEDLSKPQLLLPLPYRPG